MAGKLQVSITAGAWTPQAPRVSEECMGSFWVTATASRLLIFSAILVCVVPPGRGQSIQVSGRYECTAVKVDGKTVSCTGTPLILKNDGKFELRGWEGDYLISGHWVELSDSVVKSRAKIEPGHKIVFRYHGKHGYCEMIYERRLAELGTTSLT